MTHPFEDFINKIIPESHKVLKISSIDGYNGIIHIENIDLNVPFKYNAEQGQVCYYLESFEYKCKLVYTAHGFLCIQDRIIFPYKNNRVIRGEFDRLYVQLPSIIGITPIDDTIKI